MIVYPFKKAFLMKGSPCWYECPKCTNEMSHSQTMRRYDGTHLQCECPRCHFEWLEYPADATQNLTRDEQIVLEAKREVDAVAPMMS